MPSSLDQIATYGLRDRACLSCIVLIIYLASATVPACPASALLYIWPPRPCLPVPDRPYYCLQSARTDFLIFVSQCQVMMIFIPLSCFKFAATWWVGWLVGFYELIEFFLCQSQLNDYGLQLLFDTLVGWVLWHINLCWLLNAKSIFYTNSSISNNSV